MPSAIASFQRASFDGSDFPYKDCKIHQVGRLHEHVFLKIPGAGIEKMGRGLYRIDFDSAFDLNIRGYGNLLETLNRFRGLAEEQVTRPLTIPSIGTIDALLVDWDQTLDVKLQSGIKCPLHFIEDATQVALATAIQKANAASIQTKADSLLTIAQDIPTELKPGRLPSFPGDPEKNLWEKIQDAVNDVFGARDQADLYGAYGAAKIGYLTDIVRETDRSLKALQDPINYQIVDALHELLVASIDFQRSITGTELESRVYVVPMTMSVAQISSAIYGNASKGGEIMVNNSLVDPTSVPAGETIIYFKAA